MIVWLLAAGLARPLCARPAPSAPLPIATEIKTLRVDLARESRKTGAKNFEAIKSRYQALSERSKVLPGGPERDRTNALIERLKPLLEKAEQGAILDLDDGDAAVSAVLGLPTRWSAGFLRAEPVKSQMAEAGRSSGAAAIFDGGAAADEKEPVVVSSRKRKRTCEPSGRFVARIKDQQGGLVGYAAALDGLLIGDEGRRRAGANAVAAELLANLKIADKDGRLAGPLADWAFKKVAAFGPFSAGAVPNLFVDTRWHLRLVRGVDFDEGFDSDETSLEDLWKALGGKSKGKSGRGKSKGGKSKKADQDGADADGSGGGGSGGGGKAAGKGGGGHLKSSAGESQSPAMEDKPARRRSKAHSRADAASTEPEGPFGALTEGGSNGGKSAMKAGGKKERVHLGGDDGRSDSRADAKRDGSPQSPSAKPVSPIEADAPAPRQAKARKREFMSPPDVGRPADGRPTTSRIRALESGAASIEQRRRLDDVNILPTSRTELTAISPLSARSLANEEPSPGLSIGQEKSRELLLIRSSTDQKPPNPQRPFLSLWSGVVLMLLLAAIARQAGRLGRSESGPKAQGPLRPL